MSSSTPTSLANASNAASHIQTYDPLAPETNDLQRSQNGFTAVDDAHITVPASMCISKVRDGFPNSLGLALLFIYRVVPNNRVFSRIKQRLPKDQVSVLNKILGLKIRASKIGQQLSIIRQQLNVKSFPLALLNQCQHRDADLMMKWLYGRHDALIVQQQELHLDLRSTLITIDFYRSLSFYVFSIFIKYANRLVSKKRVEVTNKYSPSFILTNLKVGQVNPCIFNFSNKKLSTDETYALSFGLNFAVPPTRINKTLIQAQFENLFSQCGATQSSGRSKEGILKARCVLWADEVTSFRSAHFDTPIQHNHRRLISALQKNTDIIVSRPDKGNGVAVLNKTDYISKMYSILNDPDRFVVDNKQKDDSKILFDRLRTVLRSLADRGFIEKSEVASLLPRCGVVPRLYGLPKVHKTDVPLRPILSMNGSTQHLVAKWLVDVLQPVRSHFCRHTVKDSFEFVNSLRAVDVKNGTPYVFASFDVVSLFTSVPLVRCFDVIRSAIVSDNVPCQLEVDDLVSLLQLCVSNNQFF